MPSVVLIEQEPLMQELLSDILHWSFPDLLLAGKYRSAQEALAAFATRPPSLLVWNISADPKACLHLAAKTKTAHPRTKILVLVQMSTRPLLREAYAANVDGIVCITAGATQLTRSIARLVDPDQQSVDFGPCSDVFRVLKQSHDLSTAAAAGM